MKVIDVLEQMNGYDYVVIHPALDTEWNQDNPHLIDPTKVKELGWLFVQKLSHRNVVELASGVDNDGDGETFITIVYR